MTDHEKELGLEQAKEVAGRFVGLLAPYIEKALVVGSIRRGRSVVHDVDLLVVPKYATNADWFGGRMEVNLTAQAVDKFLVTHIFEARKKKDGTTMVGKGVAFLEFEGVPVDIYYADDSTWYGLMLIRTGSAAHNQSLATKALHQGKRLHADGTGVWDAEGKTRYDDGKSEEGIFAALGLAYRRPDEREIT